MTISDERINSFKAWHRNHYGWTPAMMDSKVKELFAVWNAAIEAECQQPASDPVCQFIQSPYGNYQHLVWADGYVAKIGDKFYAAPQPPVPCRRCADFEAELADITARDNTPALVKRIEDFDRHVTAIGHHVGATCGGVDCDPKEEHGTAAAIIAKFDSLAAKVAELEAENARLTNIIEELNESPTTLELKTTIAQQAEEITRLKGFVAWWKKETAAAWDMCEERRIEPVEQAELIKELEAKCHRT